MPLPTIRPPSMSTFIEPFAGGAGYALRYPDLKVTLVKADAEIHGMWEYLLSASPDEILALPTVVEGSVDDLDIEWGARTLIAFWLNKGGTTAKKTASAWARSGIRPKSYWGPEIRERIANQVDSIRHWEIVHGDYTEAPDIDATWFIDPPYQGPPGRLYRHKIEDYRALGDWCCTRQGQVMVCERPEADWLPFEPFITIKATPGRRGRGSAKEVLWQSELDSLAANPSFTRGYGADPDALEQSRRFAANGGRRRQDDHGTE